MERFSVSQPTLQWSELVFVYVLFFLIELLSHLHSTIFSAIGGKFWQLMLAERALQSACGAEREIKVFAEANDINLEYCDREDADNDCNLMFDGRPVRHVRLDASVAVIDEIKRQEVRFAKTVPIKKFREEEAPWFM